LINLGHAVFLRFSLRSKAPEEALNIKPFQIQLAKRTDGQKPGIQAFVEWGNQ
jgi:hypothetical protein